MAGLTKTVTDALKRAKRAEDKVKRTGAENSKMMARGLFVGGGIIGGGAAGWLDARYARRFEAIPNSALVGFGLLGVGLWLDDDFWSDGMLGFGVGMVSPAAYSFMAERTTAKAVGDGA